MKLVIDGVDQQVAIDRDFLKRLETTLTGAIDVWRLYRPHYDLETAEAKARCIVARDELRKVLT